MAKLNLIGTPEDLYTESPLAVHNFCDKVFVYYKNIDDIATIRLTVANGVVIEDCVEMKKDGSMSYPIPSWLGERAFGMGIVSKLGYKLIRSYSLGEYLGMVS